MRGPSGWGSWQRSTWTTRGLIMASGAAERKVEWANLLFWLCIGASAKGAGSKPLERRHRALSFVVGTRLPC